MAILTLYLIAFIILFIVGIILSLTPLLTFHQKLHKIIFHQKKNSIIDILSKTSYNNIIALTHLLQTKHFQNFYQK